MKTLQNHLKSRLSAEPLEIFVYLSLYLLTGLLMDTFGRVTQIAWFSSRWQILTCYGLYLVPASLYVRKKSNFDQYLYGLLFLSILEFIGYTLKTSVIADDNILDYLFTRSNFSLAMVVFFAGYIPLGNHIVRTIVEKIKTRKNSGKTG